MGSGEIRVAHLPDRRWAVQYHGAAAMNSVLVRKKILRYRRAVGQPLDDFGRGAVNDAAAAVTQQVDLVAIIILDREVPINVFGIKRGQHRDIAEPAKICSLITRNLDHRNIGGRAVDPGDRDANIPDQRHPSAEPSQNVRNQRGRGALSLGPGHTDRREIKPFGKPQVQQRCDVCTRCPGGLDFAPV